MAGTEIDPKAQITARGAAAACVAARDSGVAPASEKMGTVERAADDGSTPRAAGGRVGNDESHITPAMQVWHDLVTIARWPSRDGGCPDWGRKSGQSDHALQSLPAWEALLAV